MALMLFLLSVGVFSVLGVGNEGVPWAWSEPGAAQVETVDPGIERGVVLLPLGGLVTASFRRAGGVVSSSTPEAAAAGVSILEARGGSADHLLELERRGYSIVRPLSSLHKGDLNPFFGGVHAIALEKGCWQGAADPRRDGTVGFVEGAR
jgi:gamma-glutamyltranspeptidase